MLGVMACAAPALNPGPKATVDSGAGTLIEIASLGVFRPDNNGVALQLPDGGMTTFHLAGAPFGGAAKLPVSGDFDGDGQDTLGLYDPDTGDFVLSDQMGAAAATRIVSLGIKGGRPLAGDFDGDGVDTLGVFEPLTSTFWLASSPT